jgi:CHAD domain-containing protein
MKHRAGKRDAPFARRSMALPDDALRTLDRILKRQWTCFRRDLKRCQHKFSTRSVHQSRVAARRLFSTIDLLASCLPPDDAGQLKKLLKRHLDAFDDLRDTQVQLDSLHFFKNASEIAGPFAKWLCKREAHFACCCQKTVRHLKLASFKDTLRSCRKALQHHPGYRAASRRVGPVLLRAVDSAFARTVALREKIDPSSTKSIHRTRVAFKQFRYMLETLLPLLPKTDERLCISLRRYQSRMGTIQDMEVLLHGLDKFLKKKHLAHPTREKLQQHQALLISRYLKGADELYSFWPLTRSTRRTKLGA